MPEAGYCDGGDSLDPARKPTPLPSAEEVARQLIELILSDDDEE